MDQNIPRRQLTFYTKDVLPAKVTKHIFKNTKSEIDELVSDQVAIVRESEKEFHKIREKLIESIHLSLAVNDYHAIATLSPGFLDGLLTRIMHEETKARNEIIGQQECVEMFKGAVSDEKLSINYLDSARTKRDDLTSQLSTIIESREVVFSALEILRRTDVASTANHNSESLLGKLKLEYVLVETALSSEHDKLKMFTEWQNNPEASRKGLKKLKLLSTT